MEFGGLLDTHLVIVDHHLDRKRVIVDSSLDNC